MGWGGVRRLCGQCHFFFLVDFLLVFQLSFPSTPCPQESVTTPWELSRFLCQAFFVLGSIGVLHQKLGVMNKDPPSLLWYPPLGPSEYERISHQVTERSVVQVTEEVALLFWRLPPVNFPKSSRWDVTPPLGNCSCFLTSFPPPGGACRRPIQEPFAASSAAIPAGWI